MMLPPASNALGMRLHSPRDESGDLDHIVDIAHLVEHCRVIGVILPLSVNNELVLQERHREHGAQTAGRTMDGWCFDVD